MAKTAQEWVDRVQDVIREMLDDEDQDAAVAAETFLVLAEIFEGMRPPSVMVLLAAMMRDAGVDPAGFGELDGDALADEIEAFLATQDDEA